MGSNPADNCFAMFCTEHESGVDADSHQEPIRVLMDALTLLDEEGHHDCQGSDEDDAATLGAVPDVSEGTGNPLRVPTFQSLGARHLGMFFLRQVVLRQEGGGEEFLRSQLRRRPLDKFPWHHVDERISAFSSGSDIPQVIT